MPGHTVSESLKEETTQALIKIENLVKEHDVLFLLTDSRESRWLPTMLGVAHNKVRHLNNANVEISILYDQQYFFIYTFRLL